MSDSTSTPSPTSGSDSGSNGTANDDLTEDLDLGFCGADPSLALLLTPPFDCTPLDPERIKGYPPGLRENGGQYSLAAMWAVLAHAPLGNGNRAHALFALLNAINHALTTNDTNRYEIEPYVIAADVYSTAPHEGRGGWTWYTGSAGGMHHAGIEGILGLTCNGSDLQLNPCLPKGWPEMTLTVTLGDFALHVTLANNGTKHGVTRALLDDVEIACDDGRISLLITKGAHRLHLTLG